jgi:hypothetical protein
MGTSTVRLLSEEEMAQLPVARRAMEEAGKSGTSSRFNFFAAFDGTNNDKDNLKLSGDPYPTNVANLHKQALSSRSEFFDTGYYRGVGTGGDQGHFNEAAFNPTPAVDAGAEKAYGQFLKASLDYLRTHPNATAADLGASVVCFSRGCATGIRFAQLVNDRGLVAPDGTEIAKPGSVPITAMAMLDPVAFGVKGDLRIPPNVKAPVLVVQAEHENRRPFRPLDYSGDPRVTTVRHPGNHVGVGAGYDRNGTAANAQQGLTGFFQSAGVGLGDVPPDQRFDPSQPARLFTENHQTARNGDLITNEDGQARPRWPLDDPARPRIQVKPPMSEPHKALLTQAYVETAPRLKARGLSPEQCLQVSAACLAVAAEHAHRGAPQRFVPSRDSERVAVLYRDGRFDEVRVDEALQTRTAEHLERAQAAQALPVPERSTPAVRAPARTH